MTDGSVEAKTGFVTVRTAGQLFGLGIAQVRDVFVPKGLSTVPLAPPEVAGLLNLRGRIVTAIDLRLRLGLPRREADASRIAIGIEERGELYGLLVDEVGDVLWVTSADLRGQSGQSRSALGASMRRRASARRGPHGRSRCQSRA